MSNNGLYAPVIAGLAIGILLIAIFAFIFRPAIAKTDDELIANTKELPEVQYFLARYADAKIIVDRQPKDIVVVSYQITREICRFTDSLGNDCTRTLSLDVIMRPLDRTQVQAACLGPITYSFMGNPIEYIERGGCTGLEVTVTEVSMKLPATTSLALL